MGNNTINKHSPLQQLSQDEYYKSKDGYIIFTKKYHLKRGYCCNSNCMHCPYSKKTL